MTDRCWFFHAFGKWTLDRRVRLASKNGGELANELVVQCRTCAKCGYVEYRQQVT